MNKPQTFNDTNDWLAARVNVPTGMTSKQLALSKNFQSTVRANCFFSAQVAESHILDGLRKVSDSYSRGEINLSTARTKLKSFLIPAGYKADDVSGQDKPPPGVDLQAWKDAKKLSNLASTARLNLILNQNASMARAVGKRQVSMDPDILKRFPYFRYVPSIKRNKRPQHKRYYDLILPKADPFWNTHTPPSDFACACSIEDIDAEEAKEFGGIDKSVESPSGQNYKLTVNGKFVAVGPNESGYEFDIREAFDTCEMSRINDIPMRKAVFAKLRAYTRKHDSVRFTCSTGALLKSAPVTGSIAPVEAYMQKNVAAGVFTDEKLILGNLSSETADAIGVTNAAPVVLEKGTSAYGLAHMQKRHAKELVNGTFTRAVNETLFGLSVETRIVLSGKKMSCTIANKKTGAFATLHHYGQFDEWKVVSAHYPGEKHSRAKGGINK